MKRSRDSEEELVPEASKKPKVEQSERSSFKPGAKYIVFASFQPDEVFPKISALEVGSTDKIDEICSTMRTLVEYDKSNNEIQAQTALFTYMDGPDDSCFESVHPLIKRIKKPEGIWVSPEEFSGEIDTVKTFFYECYK